MKNKTKLLFIMIFIVIGSVQAQRGLFVKFSLGPGYTLESSKINSSGLSIATKNHSIGWWLNDKFALYIGEFGGLNKIREDEYNYINLDAYGIGFTYLTPIDFKLSMTFAYSKVSLAEKWYEPLGDDAGNGLGVNLCFEKEWIVASRWGLRLGPQAFFLNTKETKYRFTTISLNGSIIFYLTPIK